ncbi:hypothetical protein JTB14_008869 [Gonioctena quinquepunctata]|nr:hypothetical protein JTB14_008869 [Gonioctena quinquepunctata]
MEKRRNNHVKCPTADETRSYVEHGLRLNTRRNVGKRSELHKSETFFKSEDISSPAGKDGNKEDQEAVKIHGFYFMEDVPEFTLKKTIATPLKVENGIQQDSRLNSSGILQVSQD